MRDKTAIAVPDGSADGRSITALPSLAPCDGNADGDAAGQLRRDMLALLPDLRAFARFLVRDRHAADDLVQDTVLRALGALAQFQPGSNLKAWLFTILRNLFFEQSRRRRREAAALGAQPPQDSAVRPDQADLSDLRDLQQTLWALPALLREALVLVGAQELTYEEAALGVQRPGRYGEGEGVARPDAACCVDACAHRRWLKARF